MAITNPTPTKFTKGLVVPTIETAEAVIGSVNYNPSAGRFQGHDGGSFKSLAFLSDINSGGGVASGFYTPSATPDSGIINAQLEEHIWTCVGDIVTVYGAANITFNGNVTSDFTILKLSVPTFYPINLSKNLIGTGVAALPQTVPAIWATKNASGGSTADILMRTVGASGVKYIFYSFRYQATIGFNT